MENTKLLFVDRKDILEQKAFQENKLYVVLFVVGEEMPDRELLEKVLMYRMPLLCFYGTHMQAWEDMADDIIVEKYMDVEPHMCTTVHDEFPEAVSFWHSYYDERDEAYDLVCALLSSEKDMKQKVLSMCVSRL